MGLFKVNAGNGTSVSDLNYTFIDSSASTNSTLFYRLQMESKDGNSTYSDIRTIVPDAGKFVFTVYPNPASAVYISILMAITTPLYDNV